MRTVLGIRELFSLKERGGMEIKAVVQRREKELKRLPNVTGVGLGEKGGKEVIVVFVTHKVPEHELRPGEAVPKSLDGFETDVQVRIRVGNKV